MKDKLKTSSNQGFAIMRPVLALSGENAKTLKLTGVTAV